jgi:ligand-binding sensor domain-containing protein
MPSRLAQARFEGTAGTEMKKWLQAGFEFAKRISPRLWLAGFAVAVAAAVGLLADLRAHLERTLAAAKDEAAAAQHFPFESRLLGAPVATGVEWVSSPVSWSSGVVYQGRIYLAGATGLFEYNADGTVGRSFRPGRELPAAPLVSLAVGTPRGALQPELLIGTRGAGLLRFDGSALRQILPRDAAARDITAILPLSTGDVLVGTRKLGVLLFSGENARGREGADRAGKLAYFQPTLSNLAVTALAGDAGDVWVGTQDRGVMHWHGGEADALGTAQGLPDEQITALMTRGSKSYAGTPLGVAEFESGRFVRVLARNYFAQALAIDEDALAIGTVDEGILRVPLAAEPAAHRIHARGDSATQTNESAPTAAAATSFFAIEDGLAAVTSDGLLVHTRNDTGWRSILRRDRPLLTDGNVSALAFAPDGNLWVGYFDRGLDVVTLGASIEKVTHHEDEHLFCVNRIVADSANNRMAVATANGLALFDAGGKLERVLGRRDGLIADHVTDVAEYRGGLALATPAGLTFLDDRGAQSLYAFQGLVNNHVYALGVAHDRVLAGTLGGISVLQNEAVVRNLTVNNSQLRHNWITAILPVGDEWFVGTYGAGVMKLDADGHFEAFEKATRPMEINPNAMLATSQHVFAGTLGDGLSIYDRGSQRWRAWTAGLPSMNVTALAERGGEIYIGTDNGLVRVAEGSLTQ